MEIHKNLIAKAIVKSYYISRKYSKCKRSHTDKGGVFMATSSITKNFVISGQKQVEMFADAIEASANNPMPPINAFRCGMDSINVKEEEKTIHEVKNVNFL